MEAQWQDFPALTFSHCRVKPLGAVETPVPRLKPRTIKWGPLGLDLHINLFKAFQGVPNRNF